MIIIRGIGNWYALEFFFIVVIEQYIPPEDNRLRIARVNFNEDKVGSSTNSDVNVNVLRVEHVYTFSPVWKLRFQ